MTSVKLNEAPLSSAQETLHLLAGVPGAERAYHVHACLRLHGPLDAEALEAAVRHVVSRHPTLAGGDGLIRLDASSEEEAREAAAREVVRPRCEPGLGRALRELASAEGADQLAVSLAALGALLRRYTGHEDVVVGMPYDGRPPGAEDAVGCFGTSVPVHLRPAAESSFRELVAATAAAASAAKEHGVLPLPQIVEALHDDPERSRVPLYRVALVVEDERPPELPGL